MKKSPLGIHHPIFELLSNRTRRDMLRIIACEHTYGTRLANLLQLSVPAVHRHLKLLEEYKVGDHPLIVAESTTNESYRGHKGAEAKIFKVDSKVAVFLSIMPSYIHASVYEEPVPPIAAENHELMENEDRGDGERGKMEPSLVQKNLRVLRDKVSRYNNIIEIKEKEIIHYLQQKEQAMQEVDTLLDQLDLSFEERLVLRSYLCHGKRVLVEIQKTIKIDPILLESIVKKLKERGFIEEELITLE